MNSDGEMHEQLGPRARLRAELLRLESRDHEFWLLVVFAAAVLVLGVLALLFPSTLWPNNTLELRISPQLLFAFMAVMVVLMVYLVRKEMTLRKLRLASLEQALAAQSESSANMVDALTNVFSRNFLREILQREIARAERNNRPLALVMSDVNNFKQVNDRHGHLAGDHVLAEIAAILKSCARGSDHVIRYGGDEFLIILSETDEAGAETVRRRIQQKMAERDQSDRLGDIRLSLSLGVFMHVHGQSAEMDIAEADRRMYAEKLAYQRGEAIASASSAQRA